MKTMKKAAALIAAVALGAGVMAISAFAEDTYKLYVNSDKASVGDTVTVSVIADTSEGIGGISFSVNYNPEELELQSDTLRVGDAISNWITGDEGGFNLAENGKIGLAYVTMGKGFSESNTEIMSASFKVLKPNSVISLSDVVLNADDTDSTDITDNGQVVGTTVECSHKNTETKTEIEDCEKGGKTITACKDCGETVKTEDIAPTEHKVDKWTVTKEATCTENGEEEGVCTVCGKTVTRETEMIDHSFGEWKVTTPATCTAKGVETSTCSVCGEARTREINALGHDFGEWTVVKEATCTEKGTEERTCSRCDEKETRENDMIDHTVEWKVTKEATCTEEGEKTGTCTACGSTATEEIPALGHDWGEWKVVEEATTEKEGSEERECGRCGEKETRVIDKLAPVETDETTASSDPAVTTSPDGSSNNGSGSGNPATGVALAIIPLVAAGAAVIVFCKKRK